MWFAYPKVWTVSIGGEDEYANPSGACWEPGTNAALPPACRFVGAEWSMLGGLEVCTGGDVGAGEYDVTFGLS